MQKNKFLILLTFIITIVTLFLTFTTIVNASLTNSSSRFFMNDGGGGSGSSSTTPKTSSSTPKKSSTTPKTSSSTPKTSSSTPKPTTTKSSNKSCTNHTWLDGKCTKCGISCSHSWKHTYTNDGDTHSWVFRCATCKLVQSSGSGLAHTWGTDGKCTLCKAQKPAESQKCSDNNRISGHPARENTYPVPNSGGNSHTAYYTCTICRVSYKMVENCDFQQEQGSNDYEHWTTSKCKRCGKTEAGKDGTHYSHTYTGGYENYNNSHAHRRKCVVCDRYSFEDHKFSNGRCTVCGYTQQHQYNASGYCKDCGKRVSVTSGTIKSLSEKSGYTPGDPGISSWGGGSSTETIDGVWAESGSMSGTYQHYTAHNTSWHNAVYESLEKRFPGTRDNSNYLKQLSYGGAMGGSGSVSVRFSKGSNTVQVSGCPSGRTFLDISGLGLSKRYTSGGGMSTESTPPSIPTDPQVPITPPVIPTYTVNVSHVDADTGELMLGTSVTTKNLPLLNERSLTLSGVWEGYINKGATLDGQKTSTSKSAENSTKVYSETVTDTGKNRDLVFYYTQDTKAVQLLTYWREEDTGINIIPAESTSISRGNSATSMSKETYITSLGYHITHVDIIVGDKVVHTNNTPLEIYKILAEKSGNFSISGMNIKTSEDIILIFYYERPKFKLKVEYQDEEGHPLAEPKEDYLPTEPTVERPKDIPGFEFKESKKDDDPPTNNPDVPVGDPQRDTVIVFVYEQKDPELHVEYQDEDGNPIADPEIKPLPEDPTVETPKDIPGYDFKESKKDDEDPTPNPEVPVGGSPRRNTVVIFIYKIHEDPLDNFADKDAQIILRSNNKGNEEYNVEVAIPTSEDLYANIVASGFILKPNDLQKVEAVATITYTYYQKYEEITYDESGNIISVDEGAIPYTVTKQVPYVYYRPTGAALYRVVRGTVTNDVIGTITLYPAERYGVTLLYGEGGELADTEGVTYLDGVSATKAAAEAVIARLKSDKNFVATANSNLEAQVQKATIKMGKLGVIGRGINGKYMILDGQKYTLANSFTYAPTVPAKFPTIQEDVLYRDNNLYVNNIANGTYGTTGTVTYELTTTKGAVTASQTETRDLTGNVVKVHTPVVNNSSLNLTENNQYNQLVTSAENVVVLGRAFTVRIPNNGQHRTDIGYGNRVYNYGGVIRDKNTTNPNKNHFAKAKKVVFDKVGVIYNGQYYKAGTEITLSVSQENFTFIIPEWEREAWNAETVKMTTYVVAENCTNETLRQDGANLDPQNYVATKELALRVIGEMGDLQIRATNDPDWAKIKEVLPTDKMPLGQAGQNQVTAYRYALKLGYSAYFDLKVVGSKGETSSTVNITPSYYYIPKAGGTAQRVDLYYHNSASERFVRLSTKPITLDMTLTSAYGTNFNPGFNTELSKALQVYTQKYSYTTKVTLGTSSEVALGQNVRLPFVEKNNQLRNEKYKGVTLDAETSQAVENAIGHWYGSIRVPASTLAVPAGTTNVNANSSFLQNGYIAIVFDKVETKLGSTPYLSYAKGATKWPNGGTKTITLPNGATATVPDGTAVLYEANIRANNDYETSGTH